MLCYVEEKIDVFCRGFHINCLKVVSSNLRKLMLSYDVSDMLNKNISTLQASVSAAVNHGRERVAG